MVAMAKAKEKEAAGRANPTRKNNLNNNNNNDRNKKNLENGLYVHSSPPKAINSNNGQGSATIRDYIRAGDIEALEEVVLQGQGTKLVNQHATDQKVRNFLKTVPSYMSKIDLIHDAVEKGNLRDLKALLDRRKLARSKDAQGVGLLHKAVVHDHRGIVDYLISDYPETLDVTDHEGRTPLHYCAASNFADDMYSTLSDAVADPQLEDNNGKTAADYMSNPRELNISKKNNKKGSGDSKGKRMTPPKRKSPAHKIRTPPKREGMTITGANIRIWIHDKDLTQLEKIVWEGQGHRLLGETSNNAKVRQFLNLVPRMMTKIKEVHQAAINGDLETLDAKADPTDILIAKDQNGLTPLHKSAALGLKDVSEWIVQKNHSTLFAQDNKGRTPLFYAGIAKDGGEVYDMLLRSGADKNHNDQYRRTADHYRFKPTDLDVSIIHETPVAPRGGGGSTLDIPSRSSGSKEGSRAPSRNGKSRNPSRRNSPGEDKKKHDKKNDKEIPKEKITALHEAAASGNVTNVRRLVKENQKLVMARDKDGAVALHHAAKSGDPKVTKYVMSLYPEAVTLEDNDGRTPLHYAGMARGAGADEVFSLLEKEGARPDEADLSGNTPEDYRQSSSRSNLLTVDNHERGRTKTREGKKGKSNGPSRDPSKGPSKGPSRDPSKGPSRDPSKGPSKDPAKGPSKGPSKAPSREPSKSREKSKEPSKQNSKQASKQNSKQPSKQNSKQPSRQNSRQPSKERGSEPSKADKSKDPSRSNSKAPSRRGSRGSSPHAVVGGAKNNIEIIAAIAAAEKNDDYKPLNDIVIRGDGEKLIGQTSKDPEVNDYLKKIPESLDAIEELHSAVEAGETRKVMQLLDKKQKAQTRDGNHANILHKAVLHGHTDLVRYIISSFPELAKQEDLAGRTPLHYAAVLRDGGHIYKILEKEGGNPKAKDKSGHSPEEYKNDPKILTQWDLMKELEDGIGNSDAKGRPDTKESEAGTPTHDGENETKQIDPVALVSLEEEYEKFASTESRSLLKKYLTQEVFDDIKSRVTAGGATLHDCVRSGFANPDSHIGLYAPDTESYSCFNELFDPVINEYHGGFGPDDTHPGIDFGEPSELGDLNEFGDYVVSTRVRCARSVEGYPFNPLLTSEQYAELEQDIVYALEGLEDDLAGHYRPLHELTAEEQEELLGKHLLFKEGDRFLEAAGASRFWPGGRGIFLNSDDTLVVWVNEEDHLRIISMQEGGNLGEVYDRFVRAVTDLDKMLPFSFSKRLGFLTFCPTNLGTAIRASVHIRLPKLGENRQTLEETADKFNLQVRGTSGEHTEAEDGVFDISNRRRLGITEIEALQEMYNGVKEIIQLEQSLEESDTQNSPDEEASDQVDPSAVSSLDEEYEKFTNTESTSLLKKYLTQDVFDNIKHRSTAGGATLHDCIKSGLANPDSNIGLYAPDAESYACFKELFDPVIDEYHGGFGPDNIHPEVNFGDPGVLGDLNEWGDYVVSTRVRCARSVKGYPFNPLLTNDQYVELEQDITIALESLEDDLSGVCRSLSDISPEEQEELIEKHLLFKQGDRFLEAAGASRFWPEGRGIFLNADNTLVIWVNEEDHLRIISMQEGGNLSEVYSRFVRAVTTLGEKLPFSSSEHLGFLSFCPTNLGTGIRASVHIRLPKLGEDMQTLEETANKYNLQVRGTSGEHSEAKGHVYDISNRRRLGITEIEAIQEMYDGVKEIIQLEKDMEDSNDEASPDGEDGSEQLDATASFLLEEEYKNFSNTESSSLLKRHLTPEIFDAIKDRTTALGATFYDCIKSGFANPDSHIGLYAPDAESYACFKELFDPVIDEYHGGFGPDDTHPTVDFGDPTTLGDLNAWGDYVVSTRVRCARSVEGYPFNPLLTSEQYTDLEQNVSNVLQTLEEDLAGNYRPISEISPEDQEELLEKHLLFKQGDRFLEAAGACRFWPEGRGIFLNGDNTLVIWVNEEDHLRIISMQEGGNLSEVYSRFVRAVTTLGEKLPFSSSEHLGFLSFCPTNLGTGIRASVHIRLPKLGEDMQTLEETANKYNLQVRGTSGEHSEAKGHVYDVSNRRRLGITEIEAIQEMYDGVKEIIQLEKSMEDGSNENNEEEGSEQDPAATISLDEEYEKFSNTESSSLLKKHLTPEIFDAIKDRTTSLGATLYDCIKSGFANPDSHIGLYAPDAESYACFKELFDPVIDEYHGGFGPDVTHPTVDFGDPTTLGDLNAWGDYVVSTRVRCARSVEGYPFNPLLTSEQYTDLEQNVSNALQTLEEDLAGNYRPISEISPEDQEELLEKHLLFKQGDRFLEAAGACRFWPEGRGIFLNGDNTLVIWVNEEDHMRIISMQEGGNLSEVYSRFVRAVTTLGEKLPFSSSEHLGFLSFCPTNLGTGIRASVHIRLPKLGEDMQTLEETANKYNLQVRGTSGEHSEAKGHVYDVSNRRRLGITEIEAIQEMYDGVKEIIQLEKSMEDSSNENTSNDTKADANLLSDRHKGMLSRRNSTISSKSEFPGMWSDEGQYLTKVLGDALVNALSEVNEARPKDPISYLACSLYNYRYSEKPDSPTNDSKSIGSTGSGGSGHSTIAMQTALDSTGGQQQTSPQTRDKNGQNVLHFAASRPHGRSAFYRLVAESGCNLADRDDQYRTPRDVAEDSDLQENVRAIDKWIINLAAEGKQKQLKKLLIDGYDHIADVDDDQGNNILNVAQNKGQGKTVDFLRGLAAFEEKRDWLHKAIRVGSLPHVQYIADSEDIARAKDVHSRTSLHIATLCEEKEIMEFLATQYPDLLKIGDNLERTPLHYAMAVEGVDQVAKVLVQAGARRAVKDLRGRTPSGSFIHPEIVRELQKEERKLTDPNIKPIPEEEPGVPEEEPGVPEEEPSVPEEEPGVPEEESGVPEEEKPVVPEEEPVVPEGDPGVPEEPVVA
ncbi:uncharacterized protein LOC135214834 isoform X3 [Macrobrachium nipponense]|uniref:uncharacterized protein LOC135214834 isoform X3 n=1 Tax=Macrobrachium nipponense TaxID=159736 RepID=UPI0030C8D257